MLQCPNLKARSLAALGAPPAHVLGNFRRLGRPYAARLPLSACLPLATLARDDRLQHLRTSAAAGLNATDGLNVAVDDDDHEGYGDDGVFIPPPLPTSALELLSEVLTQLAASNAEGPTGILNAADGASYQPLRFCVNCCRPLAAPGAVCTGCGHESRRNAEVLGDPTAWVDAYAAQLQQQQQQDDGQLQHHSNQQQDQHQHEIGATAAAAAAMAVARERGSAAVDVLLAADARTLLHRSSLPPYPGRPERLRAIMSRLHSAGLLERCRLLACRPATDPELLAVHSRELVEAVRGMGGHIGSGGRCCGGCSSSSSNNGNGSSSGAGAGEGAASSSSGAGQAHSPLCADTLFNAHTGTAALLAAGAAADMGVALASGMARSGMAVMRPPGAQAGIDVARGGCYLNNVAVAAAAALSCGQGIQRVMIVDWDVHHGRGTQEIFANDPRVMVVSMHRYDSETYPGSGAVEDVGEGEGEGTTLNIPFGCAAGGAALGGLVDGDLLSAALHVVLPVAHQFRPQVVLVAAGFGALKGDPIGGCSCSPAVFAHLTHLLAGVAPRGLGLLLEGGYNLAATSEAVESCLRVLLGEAPPPLPGPWGTTSEGWVAIMNAMQIHSHYWSSLHPLSFHGWTSAIANQQRQLQEQQQMEEERQLALREQQEEQERLQRQHDQHHYVAAVGAVVGSAAAAAAVGGWAPAGLRDDDVVDDDDYGDCEGNGDGLSSQELARVAAELQRTRETLGMAQDGGTAAEENAALAAARELAAAELADPRDIDPAELLDVFLGTGGGGVSSSSSSDEDRIGG